MEKKQLAQFMHDTYEELAVKHRWKTQEDCRVEFKDLPKANKKVMLELADAVLWYLSLSHS